MDDAGTPLNKSPVVATKDVDLHRLFGVVHKMGGYNRVTNQTKWRSVANRLKLPNNQITCNQVKSVYKKCLLSYESFYRTLGVTMLNHTRTTKKNKGRSLIRDKDRTTPVNSPKPEKEEEIIEKKEEEKVVVEEKPKKKPDTKKEDEKKKKEVETSDTNSSDATDQSEPIATTSREVGRPRRIDKLKEKKNKIIVTPEKPKPVEIIKKEDEEKTNLQQTRSKSQIPKMKEVVVSLPEKKKEVKPSVVEVVKPVQNKIVKKVEEEKKRGRKKSMPEEKASVEIVTDSSANYSINVGDKLKVFYGPTHESKVTYEAKVIEIDKDPAGPVYLVHYTGWNTRYDEWITPNRIAENLSASTKAKRLKHGPGSASGAKQNSINKAMVKRGRAMSIMGRSTATETPRSTTPSSVTSSSSRTKSPATPATRSTSRLTRQGKGDFFPKSGQQLVIRVIFLSYLIFAGRLLTVSNKCEA